jgi:hypothetical protein
MRCWAAQKATNVVRYFRTIGEGQHASDRDRGEKAAFWFELDEEGDASRQLQIYPDGHVLRYDAEHPEDEYGGLQMVVFEGDVEWWAPYEEISKDDFEDQWRGCGRYRGEP